MIVGKACGELYSNIRYYISQLSSDIVSNHIEQYLKRLEEILFVSMPTSDEQRMNDYIEEIEKIVLQISPSLIDKLIIFKNHIIFIDTQLSINNHNID